MGRGSAGLTVGFVVTAGGFGATLASDRARLGALTRTGLKSQMVARVQTSTEAIPKISQGRYRSVVGRWRDWQTGEMMVVRDMDSPSTPGWRGFDDGCGLETSDGSPIDHTISRVGAK
jgi:hypothetical protein